jgi:opacity protein-like surface antigen
MSASAGERAWYVALEGGVELDGGANSTGYGDSNSWGPSAFATLGTEIAKNFRVEGELAYRATQYDVYWWHANVHQYSFMANVVYNAPITEEFSLDIGVGLGADHVKVDGPIYIDARETEVAAQLKLGLNYAISKTIDLTVDYRDLRSFGDLHLSGSSGGVRDNTVTVGLKFDL